MGSDNITAGKFSENKTSKFLNLIMGKEKPYDNKGFASCSSLKQILYEHFADCEFCKLVGTWVRY